MTAIVDAKQFHGALSRAIGAVDRVKNLPVLQHVRLATEADELVIVATDLDKDIAVRIPAEGELEPLLIDYQRLTAILSAVSDRGQLRIEPAEAGAAIAAGRSRFSVATMSADMWPNRREEAWAHSFEVAAPAFCRLMTALAPCISTEATRIYLNGIYLHPGRIGDPSEASALLAVATDGHKLAAREIEVEGLPDFDGMILPRPSCAAIAKLFAEAGTLTISCSDRKLAVTAGGTSFVTKLIEGIFPDWRRVTPTARPSAYSYDVARLIAATRAAAAAVSADKTGKAVKLTFGDGETELHTVDLSNPAFAGTDTVAHSELAHSDSALIGLNVEYLLEMLPTLDAETVEIAPGDGSGPILLRGATFADRVVVIMPMRV